MKTTLKSSTCIALMVLVTSVGNAQTVRKPGTDIRAQAIGELTDERVREVLVEEGRVSMSGGFFEHDSADLTETSDQVLFKLASSMGLHPNMRIAIVGHTDSTGDFNYNVDLSRRRAEAVRNALLGEPYNVAPERMVALGAGSISPVASNLSEEGRALNRRVEFVLLDETVEPLPAE